VLKVRQKPYDLYLRVYGITATFLKEERHALTSQIRRSAVSIPSDIAEGYERKPSADKNIRYQTLESLIL